MRVPEIPVPHCTADLCFFYFTELQIENESIFIFQWDFAKQKETETKLFELIRPFKQSNKKN